MINVDKEYSEDEEIDCNNYFCGICEKVSLWWRNSKQSEVNVLTLEIRDKELRQKFEQGELMAVKRRFEISTAIYTVLIIIAVLMNWGNTDRLIVFFAQIGDTYAVLIIFTLLGRKWINVHHYCLLAIILTRAGWSYA